jgi:DNA-binding transcriptional LysR family regulator
MRLHQIDLNLLVTFDAIYASRNLTRAAKVLHLSQPAISHALSRLRGLFDDPLFTRGARDMVPTPFARSIAGPVRLALASLERELAPRPAFEPSTLRRRFQLGLRDVLELVWLPELAARLEKEAPLVDLVVQRVRPEHLDEVLADGSFDLVAEMTVPAVDDTCREVLMESGLVVAVREGHPALSRTAPQGLTLESYLALTHVRVSSSARSPGLEDLALARIDARRRIALRCQSYAAACRAVTTTDYALTIPTIYAPLTAATPLRLFALPFAIEPVVVHLYWHASSDADPAHAWLRDLVRQVARASLPFGPPMAGHAQRSVDGEPSAPQVSTREQGMAEARGPGAGARRRGVRAGDVVAGGPGADRRGGRRM